MPIVAWYMLSKESYMNLVINEVLPTDELRQPTSEGWPDREVDIPLCSPKNTNLARCLANIKAHRGECKHT